MVSNYLGDIDKQIREDRKETIRSMYLQCYTAEEIAEAVGLSHFPIVQEIQVLNEMEVTSKTYKTANFQDDFDPPIYNRFSYGKVTNATDHFGYSEARISFHYARYYFLLYEKI